MRPRGAWGHGDAVTAGVPRRFVVTEKVVRAQEPEYSMHIYEMMAAWYRAGRRSITAIEFAICNGAASMRRLSI